MSLPVTLPTVIIFEQHWDEAPRKLVQGLLPKLAEEGYNTLCYEAPQDQSEQEILCSIKENIEIERTISSQAELYLRNKGITSKLSDMDFSSLSKLLHLYFSSQKYNEYAERIKNLPANLLLKNTLEEAQRLSINIKGVDIDGEEFLDISSVDLTKRYAVIKKNEDYRIKTMMSNLLKARSRGEGVVFVCGAIHADNLLAKFKEEKLQDEVLYYFPHSGKSYDSRVGFAGVFSEDATLKGHTYSLLNDEEISSLQKKILKEIQAKNTKYIKEIVGGNSLSEFLCRFFKAEVKIFERPGHYVDALIEANQPINLESIIQKLKEVKIETRQTKFNEHLYLVIPDVNTKEGSDKVRLLK